LYRLDYDIIIAVQVRFRFSMTIKNKGGRGKKNPWRTKAIRMPEPLLAKFEQEIEKFLENGGSFPDSSQPPPCLISREEAERLGEDLIRQRKSLKNALPILLDAIFGESPPPPPSADDPPTMPIPFPD
jgi:hypothetical protein